MQKNVDGQDTDLFHVAQDNPDKGMSNGSLRGLRNARVCRRSQKKPKTPKDEHVLDRRFVRKAQLFQYAKSGGQLLRSATSMGDAPHIRAVSDSEETQRGFFALL